jgi:hypothetical protein
MMEHMRQMGNSGKFAVVCGIVAAGLLVLTAMTLAEPVLVAFLGVLSLAYLAGVAELLRRRRRVALLATGAGTSITLACSLAFLSTWELAFDGESSFLGTPLPTDDPDNYFMVAAAAALATLAVLFLGVIWPSRRGTAGIRRPAPSARPSGRSPAPKQGRRSPQATTHKAAQKAAAGRTQAPRAGNQRSTGQITPSQKATGPKATGQRTRAQGPAVQRAPGQSASGTRAPGVLPPAAKRPPSPAAPARRPAPKSGNGSAPRR